MTAVKYTVTILVHNSLDILHRVVSLFRRRGLHMESLTVTKQEGVSRMIWVIVLPDAPSAEPTVRHLIAQLEKLLDVLDVRGILSPDTPPAVPTPSELDSPLARPPLIAPLPLALPQADGIA